MEQAPAGAAAWYSRLPSGWKYSRLKYEVSKIGSGGTPDTGNPHFWSDCESGIPWVAISDMSVADIVSSTEKSISIDGLRNKGLEVYPPGTILYSMYASVGKVAVLAIEAAINQAILAIEPDFTKCRPRYLRWALSYITDRILETSSKNTQDNLNLQKVRNAFMLLPPVAAQDTIADFLDSESARADSLINKYERLIELTDEKRVGMVVEAVTKGLSSDAVMKDSGIKWAEQIPEHWVAMPNKALFSERMERSVSGEETLLSVSHLTGVTPRSEKTVNMFMAETLDGYKICSRDDFVINTMWAWMGAMGTSPCDGIVSPSYNVYQIRDRQVLNPDYYDLLSRTPGHVSLIKSVSTGVWESRLRLYPMEFLRLLTCVPPIDEQKMIVDTVHSMAKRYNDIINHSRAAIEILRERRAALVTAAITGHIDTATYKSDFNSEVA